MAYSTLMAGAMCLFVAAALIRAGLWIWRQTKEDWDGDWCVASIVLWVFALGFAMIGAWHWIDPWTWTAISHPELWIAKKAMGL